MEFEAAIRAAERDMGGRGIGTLGEKTLHLALKYYFAPDPDTHEKKLGGFIADAVTEDGVFEIQTRGLSRLKPKLAAFLPLCPVTVVHPVAVNKQLFRVDAYGELLSQRRSPKHESVYTAMREIYTLRDFIGQEGFQICICAVDLAEYSVLAGKSRRQKLDRVPLALRELYMLQTAGDYAALLPETGLDAFTVEELAERIHAPEMQTRLFISLLVRMGILAEAERIGRKKRWLRYVSDGMRG